jgi:triacylglycerol esterase/lipase EstA (alpha/beta hydrolase family)
MSFNFVSIWKFDDPAAYPAGQKSVIQSQDKFLNPNRLLSVIVAGSDVPPSKSQIPSTDTYVSPGNPITILGGKSSVSSDGSVISSQDTYASDGSILSVFTTK